MPDQDPAAMLGRPPGPILGAPAPIYQPINIGGESQGMAMAMALYAPQILNFLGFDNNTFLPQQFPAQMMLDQMTSAKYIQDSAINRNNFAAPDRAAVADRLGGILERTGIGRPIAGSTGEKQMQHFAGMLSSQFGQQIAGMLIGPQNAEDVFFGRRGSGVQLANAVNQFGFYRPDAITGADRMSAESLTQFTEQLYGNLYGPGADLNDVSGLSAGRIGTVANDLAQRGLLPASLGVMPEAARKQAMRNIVTNPQLRPRDLEESVARDIARESLMTSGEDFGGKTYAQLDQQSQQEILRKRTEDASSPFRTQAADVITKMGDNTTPTDQIAKLPGASSAIRRIDASRVGNTLKDYSGAVDAVRAIFGDNGMGNAPFAQLVASLDALTQGGMASMSPGKLENIMRRTQMASRDTGVSLEALMGLTARGGALADQNGLVRDVVPEQVIATMQRTKAMRDAGSFAPGFGRMDPNTAALFVMDQQARADSSTSARLASTARRIVQENAGNAAFNDPNNPNSQGISDLRSFVAAMERGDTTFVNAAGQTVNISQQMGQNPGQFFGDLFDRAGITQGEVSARLYDEVNTQEYLLPGFAARSQRYEVGQSLNNAFFQILSQENKTAGLGLTEDQQASLTTAMGESFSTAMLDEVNNSMKPQERIQTLERATRRGVEQFVRQQNPGLDAAGIQAETDKLMKGMFATDDDLTKFVGIQQANLARNFEATTGINIEKFRQANGITVLAGEEARDRKNRARAEMIESMGGSVTGDGSNFLQRLSDYFVDGPKSGKSFAEYVLGTVDIGDKQKQLIEAAGGRGSFDAAMDVVGAELSSARVDTEAEKDAAVADIFAAGAQPREEIFENVKKRFEALKLPGAAGLFAGKTTAISTAELAGRIGAELDKPGGEKSALGANLRTLYKHYAPNATDTEIEERFNAQNRDQTIRDLASKTPGFEQYMRQVTDTDTLRNIGLGAEVATEREIREAHDMYAVAAGSYRGDQTAAVQNQERMQRVNKLMSEMAQGKIGADTIMQLTETDRKGLTDDKRVREALTTAIDKYNDATTTTTPDGKKERQSASMSSLRQALDASFDTSGMSKEEKEKVEAEKQQIIDMANFARAQRVVGGFDELGASPNKVIEQTARVSALQSALDSGTIDRQSALGQELERMKSEKPEEREAARKKVLEIVGGTEDEFKEAVRSATPAVLPEGADRGKQVQEVVDQARREAVAAGATEMPAGGGGGPFDGILNQIGDTFTKAVADSFKDVKLENVTITNLHMPNLLGSLFNGLAGDTASAKGAATPDKKATAAAGGATPTADQTVSKEDKKDQGVMTERILAFMQNVPQFFAQGAPGTQTREGSTNLSGNITITGLNTAFANLQTKQVEPTAGNGAPVVPQNPAATST